jgi:hypothetical protein
MKIVEADMQTAKVFFIYFSIPRISDFLLRFFPFFEIEIANFRRRKVADGFASFKTLRSK